MKFSIKLYTKENCPSCEKAKALLKNENISFNEIVIGKDITRDEVLSQFPGVKLAPVVVVNGIQMEAGPDILPYVIAKIKEERK